MNVWDDDTGTRDDKVDVYKDNIVNVKPNKFTTEQPDLNVKRLHGHKSNMGIIVRWVPKLLKEFTPATLRHYALSAQVPRHPPQTPILSSTCCNSLFNILFI